PIGSKGGSDRPRRRSPYRDVRSPLGQENGRFRPNFTPTPTHTYLVSEENMRGIGVVAGLSTYPLWSLFRANRGDRREATQTTLWGKGTASWWGWTLLPLIETSQTVGGSSRRHGGLGTCRDPGPFPRSSGSHRHAR